MGAELALQVSHAFDVLPRTEKVPAAHASTRAFRVAEHCLVMRLPGEVTAQAWQVGSTELGLVAKKAPAHTHAEKSPLETEFGLVHAVRRGHLLASARRRMHGLRCSQDVLASGHGRVLGLHGLHGPAHHLQQRPYCMRLRWRLLCDEPELG